jgi:enamine deaminase RidA (YjgF/YER057c/UK114 family)
MPGAKKEVTRTSRRVVGRRKKPAARPVSSAIASTLVKKTIDPGWTWDDRLPLSQAKQIGNTIYVSGQVAYDASGQLVGEGDMKAQTRQVFDNIKSILGAADARLEDIVKINTYITDSSKFMDMLGARSEIFGSDPPASSGGTGARLSRVV